MIYIRANPSSIDLVTLARPDPAERVFPVLLPSSSQLSNPCSSNHDVVPYMVRIPILRMLTAMQRSINLW